MFNKFMHPRNIYRNPPDFKDLSVKYPEFRQHAIHNLSGKVFIDFKNPVALRTLTTVLLNKDFGLDVEIPPHHLIPTLPQRLNYILWIEDLLKVLPSKDDDIIGIDIGTGPCCIYPLLGSKKNNWKFLATEVDAESLEWAIKNVQKNKLENKIQIIKVDSSTRLQEIIAETNDCLDFTMCNPPFFHELSETNVSRSRPSRRPNLKSKNIPSTSEKSTEGGEVEFVKKIIDDSLNLKEKIRLYTAMLGKKQSFQVIKNELKTYEIIRFTSCEFCQGNTMRWGIAWTFLLTVQLKQVPVLKHQRTKLPITYIIAEKKEKFEYSIEGILTAFMKLLDNVKIRYHVINAGKYYAHLHLKAKENTWSHQRRKRREQLRQEKAMQEKMVVCDKNICATDDKPMIDMPRKEIIHNPKSDCEIPMDVECDTHTLPENSICKDDSSISSQQKRERSTSSSDFSHSKKFRKVDNDGVEIEKHKMNCSAVSQFIMESSKEQPEGHILWCDVTLKYKRKSILLKMECPDNMNREPMYQVLQLFKNNMQ